MAEKPCGIYRAIVVENRDPLQQGRIKVQLPGFLGSVESAWAMPCVPCDLPKTVGSALPQVGSGVWIQFEEGDVGRPVWTGCYRSSADTPPALRNE